MREEPLIIHANVCPDCGTADSGHMLDPPPHCPHPYELFVPREFVLKEDAREQVGKVIGPTCATCSKSAELPVCWRGDDGERYVSLSGLEGWEFNLEDGWRCNECVV